MAVFCGPRPASRGPIEATGPVYDFRIFRDWLTMEDGVRLAVTYFRPVPREAGETFPALLELLPYRKDDSFYIRDYPIYAYFAKRGFIMAKVDIRGTGSSEGALPPREYSEQELDDAVETIRLLAELPGSNGRIGMWGISWGGFNALQTAMRRPRALKAVLALHASDDLFHDDVHYIDGAYHVDAYELSIDHENGLPAPPEYPLDEAFFKNRFDSYPWFLTYLKEQQDGEFWRKNGLRWHQERIRIPVYLIGGLLDGYKDCVPRILGYLQGPVKAVIGPWVHAWPDNGLPGPNYEWRHEAVRWWDYWLKGKDTGVLDDPRFTVFIRDGHSPDVNLEMTPGRWVHDDWPVKETAWKAVYPSGEGRLEDGPAESSVGELKYVPSFGIATGQWWGEPTGDMRPDDAGSFVFDGPQLDKTVEIVGFPKVFLRVSADAPLAHWMVRLEDVQPDGTVSLVTGAVLNGAQRDSPLDPKPLVPGEVYNIRLDLHFTTWTFKPGHRIRLAVTNSLFPMIWPTPASMTTRLFLGGEATRLELPAIRRTRDRTMAFLPPEPREERPGARHIEGGSWPQGAYSIKRDLWTGTVRVEWIGRNDFEIEGRRFLTYEKNAFETSDDSPAESKFSGEAGHRIELFGRVIELMTTIELRSDSTDFHVVFVRRISENGIVIREKEWREKIRRRFQ